LKTAAKIGWLRVALAFGAGALLAASFPKFSLRWLAWIAPGLILLATQAQTGRGVFWAGYVAGLGKYLVSLYWLLLIPFPWHAVAGYLVLCAVLSLCMAAWCWVCWRGLPRFNPIFRVAWPFGCAMVWVTMEMLMARLLGGFPWNFLGASQIRFLPLIQIASWTGVYGVSFAVVWVSIALVSVVQEWRRDGSFSREIAAQILPPVFVVACVVFLGMHRLSEPEGDGPKIKIALVQPSIPQKTYWDPAEKTNRFLKLMELSRRALESSPDLIVWPEAAMPDMFMRSGYLQTNVVNLLRPHPAWMVMGAGDTAPKAGDSNKADEDHFNAAFLIDPKGELVDRYYKRHLVPFGEYMPGASMFPSLAKLRSAGAGIAAGQRTTPFRTENPPAKFPVLICFEDVFPHEVRARVDAETDFVLNLTSDAWFGESAAQWQHAESAALRAVENGVPLVRCCNNGLTCWIDARGEMHEVFYRDYSDNIYMAGYKIVEVPLGDKSGRNRTFYNRRGDVFGWGCVAVVLALNGLFFIQQWRGKTSVRPGKT
jgi:apolipoprotein N-acyltransferase